MFFGCPGCGRAFEELDPRLFSFNSPHGACEECGGFGEIWNRDLQTGAEDNGDSALENELAAERESDGKVAHLFMGHFVCHLYLGMTTIKPRRWSTRTRTRSSLIQPRRTWDEKP